MHLRKTIRWSAWTLFVGVLALPLAAQAPPRKSLSFDEFVDATIAQERRLTRLMRNFKPVIETYIQNQKEDSEVQSSPKDDVYFLSRFRFNGDLLSSQEFKSSEHSKRKKSRGKSEVFAAGDFTESLFPDADHFDRQNYEFKLARWEMLGDVRCIVMDVTPRASTGSRGFMGRIWVEDQDNNIVRFTGAHTAKAYSRHSFHFDSWRLNTLGSMWMPAYVYTQESGPHDPSSRGLWFKAQTRIWGYDLQRAGDHREYSKRLTDDPSAAADPKRHETSQNLSPNLSIGSGAYTPEEDVVERLQLAGLMAPDGEVDHILETVVNNLLVTNNLDIAGVHCRVLLTTPLESFVMGRTIVLSRGLLDVVPDEATLGAILAHELAHIVLNHSLAREYTSRYRLFFPDLQTFTKLDFHFDPAKEAEADAKGRELFSKSPYADKGANVVRFVQLLEARAPELPSLLRAQFDGDFGTSHLQPASGSPQHLPTDHPDQMAAQPLGSRIRLDPWSDKIEIIKAQSAPPITSAEKRPFEVSPFFPYLKRLEEPQAGPPRANP